MRKENNEIRAAQIYRLLPEQLRREQAYEDLVSLIAIPNSLCRAEAANVHITVADKVIDAFRESGRDVKIK